MVEKEKMLSVSKETPCQICGKPDWCLIAPDGSAAICARIQEGSVKVCGEAGWLHVFQHNLYHQNRQNVSDEPLPSKTSECEINNFDNYVSQCQQRLTSENLAELSASLGVSAQSLKRLYIGWDGTGYTFPMSNDFGKIIGVRRRFTNGQKGSLKGSQTGLFIPADLSNSGPLLLCEGTTDTATALDLGFDAIGRPNCNSKVEMTVNAAKNRTEVVIIGDNDAIGKAGAKKLADVFLQNSSKVKIVYPPETIKDLRQWIASGLTAEQLQAEITQAKTVVHSLKAESQWELPAPLGQFDLPTFPLEAFPQRLCVLCELCAAVAESYQVPVDMPAMLVLSVGGASLAKKVVVHVQGDHWEPVNLFAVVALPPANRKSGVFRAVAQPLTYFEQQEVERLAPIIKQNRNQRMILEESLKHARSQAAKAKKPEERERHMERTNEILDELNGLEVLTSPQYIGDDATPESVALLLSDNDGRFALLSPEGDIFDLMAGRYSNNNAANIGVYLRGHAGDEIRINRASRDFVPRYVHHPALTIGVAVQPDVLRGLTLKKGFRGRGLLGRFLYSIPPSLLGHRKIHVRPVDPGLSQAYQDLILAALRLEHAIDTQGNLCPHTLIVSKDALVELDRFSVEIEKQLGPNGEFAAMGDWAGKLVGAVCRIAGIFHGLMTATSGCPAESQIDTETMLGAIAIGEYLIPHAKAAFFEMGADPAIDSARKILDWVFSEQLSEFARRDAFNALRGAIQKVTELDDPLQMLVNHGYIREVLVEHKGPGRKPSTKYEVNPLWLAQNTQNTHNSHVDGNSAYSAQFAREVTL